MMRKLTHLIGTCVVCLSLNATAVQAQSVMMQVTGVAQGDSLNVRTGPGGSYSDIGDIAPGTVLVILGYSATRDWAQIQYQGRIAYVSARYLSKIQRNDGSSVFTGPHKVRGIKANDADGGLVVRADAGSEFARLGVLANRAPVHVIQRTPNGRWAMIVFGNGVGWVRASYLESISQSAPRFNPLIAPDGGPLPAMFSVTGVASDDILYMRDAPRASANSIGGFAPRQGVQVLEMASPTWAKVSDGTQIGYVNIRFLNRGFGSN